ncbi:MAG TPA: dihydroorotase [Nitrospiria bacterium]|jgi:dihydroorotase|nr:dihydroorotase [Nitrospiria bacterium]
MNLLIRNGRIVDPAHRRDEVTDLLIENGKISRIGKALKSDGPKSETQTIDGTDKWVVPGLVDVHVHLREPGFEYKETIKSGTEAAAAGGFTSVCCMPNTIPVNDNQAVTRLIREKARLEGRVHVFPIGAITKGSKGEELSEIGDLVGAGCVAITDDGKPVMNSGVMRRAMEYSLAFDLPVIDHCEDEHLMDGGVMNEGVVSMELGLRGIPAAAEEVMVARNLILAELTGARLHLAHVSTAGSVRLVREAKSRGVRVTAETCPHYFSLTEEAVRGYNTCAKMNPPLRTHRDRDAIRQGLKDGTLEVIATDHAPHSEDEKNREFDLAPFGIVGLETALPLTLRLVEEGVLSLDEAVAKLTVQPARVMRLNKGHLGIGADADLCLIDPEATWTVDPSRLRSKSNNTPFAGWRMKGLVVMTIVDGRVVYSTEEVRAT